MKTKFPYDAEIFENMNKKAESLLQNAEKGEYTQAIVLYSATDKEYSMIIQNALFVEKTDELALLEQLKTSKDTVIHYVLCMWQDGSLDLSSYAFRNMLFSLDSQNANSLMFIMTADGVSVKKLSATVK